jgi:cysteine-rich CPXCG protein
MRPRLAAAASVTEIPLVDDDRFLVTCPYCGETVEIYLEPDVAGSFVQDCEVCCNPWRVRVRAPRGRGEERTIEVAKADGSE